MNNETNNKFNNGLKKFQLWIVTAFSTLILLVLLSVFLIIKMDIVQMAEFKVLQTSEKEETEKLAELRKEHESLVSSAEYAELIVAKEQALLAAAEEEVQAEEQEAENKENEALEIEGQAASALAKLNAEPDQVEKVTWYQDPTSPVYVNETGIYLEMGMKEGGMPVLDLHLQYEYDDTWFFVDSFTISADGINYELNPGYSAVSRDNSAHSLWEWYVYRTGEADHLMLSSMANADATIVRFHGKDYDHDIELSQQQKTAMENVLDAYFAQVAKYEYSIFN